ncbi:hypothetical protein VTL71DRAFT_13355 [Oculimacula yallundae]|uniref:Uncharacterized protein n=1 Tax=Oculimacula yallundae TaxID=86028 RepID=A0ABR4CK28_9HELO
MATTTPLTLPIPLPLPVPLQQKGTSSPQAVPISPSHTSPTTSSRPPSPSIDNISGFPRINTGCVVEETDYSEYNTAAYPYPNSNATPVASPDLKTNEDPFATQRGRGEEGSEDFTFAAKKGRRVDGDMKGEEEEDDQDPKAQSVCDKDIERRPSDESVDITKAPTSSHSQTPRGSKGSLGQDVHAATRTNERDNKRHSSQFEKGWARMTGRRSSRGEKD